MEIAGHNINWDGIVDSARREARSRIREAEREPFRPSSHELCEESLRDVMETAVWNALIKKLSSDQETGTSAEKAVAAIMKKGLGKDRITFRKNSFRFTLENRTFKIYKQKENFSSVPIVPGKTTPSYACQVNGMDPEVFADLVYAYDGMAPEVDVAFKEILEEFREMELRIKRERTARELTQKTVDLLIEEYIRPLGLQCRYDVNGDSVEIELEQRKKATLDIPIAELSDRLKDSSAIMEALETVPVKEERRPFGFASIFGSPMII